MESQAGCPVCNEPVSPDKLRRVDTRDLFRLECPRCGTFEMTDAAQLYARSIPNDLRPYISAATRQASESGRTLMITTTNLDEIGVPHRTSRVSEKLDKLLGYLARKAGVPGGAHIIVYSRDYPVADARDEDELRAYLDYLVNEGLARASVTGRGPMEAEYGITIKGWRQLEPVFRSGGEPGRCFVASWLDDQMDEPYRNGIAPAVKECGYAPVWMKDISDNKGITDRILSEIRRAEFVVADFTGQRQSVYFEAGFARGLGREVIWCCRDRDVDKLHFDTKHLGHVVWKDAADLRQKLEASIRANIIKKA